jgi:hypothetical protein
MIVMTNLLDLSADLCAVCRKVYDPLHVAMKMSSIGALRPFFIFYVNYYQLNF